jgi:hypothetical protein
MDGKVMPAGAEVALDTTAAGAELALAPAATEELCASVGIAIAATTAMMLRRMVVCRLSVYEKALFGRLALCRSVVRSRQHCQWSMYTLSQ